MSESAYQGLAPGGSSRPNEIELTDGADAARVSLGADAAQHNRPLPSPDLRHRTEGEDTPPREETTTADDDLVGVVNVPLVADVIQPAELRAVAREHPVAAGGGEKPAEFGLSLVAPPIPATLLHARSVVTVPAGSPRVERSESSGRTFRSRPAQWVIKTGEPALAFS